MIFVASRLSAGDGVTKRPIALCHSRHDRPICHRPKTCNLKVRGADWRTVQNELVLGLYSPSCSQMKARIEVLWTRLSESGAEILGVSLFMN